jgi:hypothetical protein
MRGGWAANAHPALSRVDGMIEASPGVEPEITRFADGALRPEHHEAVRAPGRIRTADLQVRNLALFPLSYEGMVRVPGADPGLPKRRLYRPGNVPPFTTRMGCLTGFEPASTGATSRSLMPSGVRHSTCGGSRTPDLLFVGQVLFQLSYTGIATYPRRGSNPRPSMYKIAALTAELRGHGSPGWTRTSTCTH